MKLFTPSEMSVPALQHLLQSAVGPRPIAFASTINKSGDVNLSPFSFFNIFSANPPVLIFSPARRVRDNTTKHTLDNVLEHPEVVINVVNYAIVQQMSLASSEYAIGVNEFVKAGLTELPSTIVKPPRVKESPVQFECSVSDVVALGDQGGAGNLVICKVLAIHVQDEILDENGHINQNRIDLVARLGGNWYCRASGEALFEVEKPLQTLGIGVNQIPDAIRLSPVLTGNHLGQLANIEHLPHQDLVDEFKASEEFDLLMHSVESSDFASHRIAAHLLNQGEVIKAWLVLLSSN
jgi:flavin reductase (DIM6/NTAB) family NADH-FMN oxidoreductase RutF